MIAETDHRRDRWWILLLALVCIVSGLGLRGPWAPDEPRFALAAKEMVESGQWLFPRLLGNLYPDKPPLFMWTIALCYQLIGSLKVAFLMPSMLAGLVSVMLWHDLAGRFAGRRRAAYVAVALLASGQFLWQARFAQIDGFLCMWTSLGAYGLMRHLLLGPVWRWWFLAWLAMGCGVISKGVGFLPALLLLPWAWLRWRHRSLLPDIRWHWAAIVATPLCLFLPIMAWLLPMLYMVNESGDAGLIAYRDNILFTQTAKRYADASHHHHWFGYYLVEVIPALWLPLTCLLPWTIALFRRRLRRGDVLVTLCLGGCALIVLFFSLSPGKRGVYMLPALPLFVMAHLGFLRALLRKSALQRAIAISLTVLALLLPLAALLGPMVLVKPLTKLANNYGYDPIPEVWLLSLPTLLCALLAWRLRARGRAHVALVAQIVVLWLVMGFALWPKLDPGRSGRVFMTEVGEHVAAETVIGLVHWKERFGLYDGHVLKTFGHRRDDFEEEGLEALAWMREDPRHRVIFTPLQKDLHWYDDLQMLDLGRHNRADWRLVYLSPEALR